MGKEQTSPPVNWQPGIWQSAIHVVAVVALLAVFIAIVPRFARNFEEFDLMLPAPTVLVVNMSNYLVQRWFIAIPAVMFLLAFDVAVLVLLRTVPKVGSLLSSLWFALGFAFLGLMALLTVAGLMMPLTMMVEGLATA